MNKALLLIVLATLVPASCGHAGGFSREVAVASIEPGPSNGVILHFTESEWGTCTLHIRYNAARMRGVVSEREHQAALAHLRATIAKSSTIKLGYVGFGLSKVPGTKSDYASDALQLLEGVVFVWPTNR